MFYKSLLKITRSLSGAETLNINLALFFSIILILPFGLFSQTANANGLHWVGSWGTAPQLVEPSNNPPSPGLTNNSLRQVVRISIGGETLRLKLSNEFSTQAVVMNSVQVALSTGGHSIDESSNVELKFNGNSQVTMAPGAFVVSDPFDFEVGPRSDIAITIYYGQTSSSVTGHPGSRTDSYIISGNNSSVKNFSGSVKTEHWYNIDRIDVLAPETSAAIAILGNSITDGRGSVTNQQNRWPDILSEALLNNPETSEIGVLNMGIGGNAVLSGGLGPTGLSRYERDILNQPGVKWAIIYHGINDIGGVRNQATAESRANDLIEAYKQMIIYAHQREIRIYGATLLPFKGSGYYNEYSEWCRSSVNDWIRDSGWYDAVIDFEPVLQSPSDPLRLISSYQNDNLHPDAAGYKKMGESIDLDLFVGFDSNFPIPDLEDIKWYWFEAERFVPEGSDFEIHHDPRASNEQYIEVKPGIEYLNSPDLENGTIIIPFEIEVAGNYRIYGRLNCPTYNDDSFWVSVNGGPFTMSNGLVTSGWEWKEMESYELEAGQHLLYISSREDGAQLDKICISNYEYAPLGIGGIDHGSVSTGFDDTAMDITTGYLLEQNYPNPCNTHTNINFTLPGNTFVSLKVFNTGGIELDELAGKKYPQGQHTIIYDASRLEPGIYFYELQTNDFKQTKKMVVYR